MKEVNLHLQEEWRLNMSEFNEVCLPNLFSKNILCTASLNLYESDRGIYEVRRKEGERLVDKIPLNDAQLKKLREIFCPQNIKFGMDDQDISFIADIEFKNIRIAKYEKIGD